MLQYRDRKEARIWGSGLLVCNDFIGSLYCIVQYRRQYCTFQALHSLEHCIPTMTNINAGHYSNSVHPDYESTSKPNERSEPGHEIKYDIFMEGKLTTADFFRVPISKFMSFRGPHHTLWTDDQMSRGFIVIGSFESRHVLRQQEFNRRCSQSS